MTEATVLRLDDLRSALAQALRATEARPGQEVALSGDYYWHLPVEQAFDMEREPTELTVGH